MLSKLDKTVPGRVYLCQVNSDTSCGACCGLYNLTDISPKKLLAILTRRTTKFALVKREVRDLDAFARIENRRVNQPQPFSKFHHCPFIGLVGVNKNRVGCLLHPKADGNNEVDYRGLSYYGGMACRDYFCPTYRIVNHDIKKIIRNLKLDWYSYGLIVTEAKLHQTLFNEIQKRTKNNIDFNTLKKINRFNQWFENLLTLKLTWPFRDPEKSKCHYLFTDGTYSRPAIDYVRLNTSPSRYDLILRELDSYFNSKEELFAAENYLDQILTLPD